MFWVQIGRKKRRIGVKCAKASVVVSYRSVTVECGVEVGGCMGARALSAYLEMEDEEEKTLGRHKRQ